MRLNYAQSMEELQKAISARRQASPGDDLHSLDCALRFAAQNAFVRFVDGAGLLPTTDSRAKQLHTELVNACNCMNATAYPDAEKYYNWMQGATEVARQIAEGKSIESAISEAIAEAIAKS